MPIYESKHIEYATVSGHVDIILDDGKSLPAFWSRPSVGGAFSGIVFLHDWWGIRPLERRLASALAMMGFHVLAPDLFNTRVARTADEAMKLVQDLGERAYPAVDAALHVMETHARSNHHVAVIGLGMGGSLAYEAAIKRPGLEAAVAFYGFPQRFMGQFAAAKTPILAIYGDEEPYNKPNVIKRLQDEFATSTTGHEVQIMQGVGRDFFAEDDRYAVRAWSLMEDFLDKHLVRPKINKFAH
jgi:carboxymethylenebutenolidase